MKKQPVVGDKVLVKVLWGDEQSRYREVEVTKVGRKYFYLHNMRHSKFHIGSHREVSEYSSCYELYSDINEYIDYVSSRIYREVLIKDALCASESYNTRCSLTTEQLRQMLEVIGYLAVADERIADIRANVLQCIDRDKRGIVDGSLFSRCL